MDITQLYNVTSGAVQNAAQEYRNVKTEDEDRSFGSFLQAAVDQINETNTYLRRQEEEEIKLALGLTENTHDLAIAQAKASTAIQVTTALRDKFLEAYKEIMQIQM